MSTPSWNPTADQGRGQQRTGSLPTMSVTAVILAADDSEEFATSKYLASVHGDLMLQHVVSKAADWPVDDLVVVLGAEADALLDAVDLGAATIVIDPEWAEGSASPVSAAVDLISRDRSVDWCLAVRADQPDISNETVEAVLNAISGDDVDAIVPKYRYSVGWPVLLERSLWQHVLGGEGSLDLLDVVASHAAHVEEVWIDHLPPGTIAKPDDLLRLRR
jgi:CTP:molybdopterin cytidylyltransferase MocA